MIVPEINPRFLEWCVENGLDPATTVRDDLDVTQRMTGNPDTRWRIEYTKVYLEEGRVVGRVRRAIVVDTQPPPMYVIPETGRYEFGPDGLVMVE